MFTRLFRQRRRVSVFAASAAFAVYLPTATLSAGFALPLATAVIAAITAILFVLIAPESRRQLDALAAAFLLSTPVDAGLGLGAPQSLFLIAAVALAIGPLMRLGVAAGIAPRVALHDSSSRVLNVGAEAAWARLVPGAGHTDDHWSGKLAYVEPTPRLDGAQRMLFDLGDAGDLALTVRALDSDPGYAIRWAYDAATDLTDESGVCELTMTPLGDDAVRLDVRLDRHGVSLPVAIAAWLDDATRDAMDACTARLEARKDRSVYGAGSQSVLGTPVYAGADASADADDRQIALIRRYADQAMS